MGKRFPRQADNGWVYPKPIHSRGVAEVSGNYVFIFAEFLPQG